MKLDKVAVVVALLSIACGGGSSESTPIELDASAAEVPVLAKVGQTLELTLSGIGPQIYELEGVEISSSVLSLVSATIPVLTPGGHASVYTFRAKQMGEASVTIPRSSPDQPAFVFEVTVE